MDQKTFEGTWEEIVRHGDELAGHRVRLTVLNEPPSPVSLDRALAHLIEQAELLASTPPPAPPTTPDGPWEEGLLEKYRRQGFKL